MYNRGSRRTTSAGSRTGGRGGFRRHGGQDELARAMGRMSFGSGTQLEIPPLSSFVFASEAVAGEFVEAGERVGSAESIPLDFQTPSAYLRVSIVSPPTHPAG